MEDYISKSLFIAVMKADLESVRKLVLRYGLSYCEDWFDGYLLLCDAIGRDDFRAAKFLIRGGAEVNPKTEYVSTPLHFAVRKNHVKLTQSLLRKNAKVDARNDENKTALHIAVENGYIDIVNVLIKNNANMIAENEEGLTPLLLAVSHNHRTVVDALLRHAFAASKIKDKEESLRHLKGFLCRYDFPKTIINQFIVQTLTFNTNREKFLVGLIDRGIIRSREYVDEALAISAMEKYYFAMIVDGPLSFLFKSFEACCFFVLHTAVQMKFIEVVSLLLKSGFNANAKDERGKTCLHYALPEGLGSYDPAYFECVSWASGRNCSEDEPIPVKMLEMLFESGATIQEAPGLLHEAVQRRSLKACQILIKNGADVNALDFYQGSPLHVLATPPCPNSCFRFFSTSFQEVNRKIGTLLFDNGADPSIVRVRDGRTALIEAGSHNETATIQIFLDFGVNINLKDVNGQTILHSACHCRDGYGVVKFLCEKGADVNARDKNGWTPLHFAASISDHSRMIETLLQCGAHINARGSKGETPLHCAAPHKKNVIALLDNGCDINVATTCGATALDTSIYGVHHFRYWDSAILYRYLNEFKPSDESKNLRGEPRQIYHRVPDDHGPGFIKKHIIKLEVAGLDVSERNSVLVRKHRGSIPDSERERGYHTRRRRNSFTEFREQCQKEVDHMKNVNVYREFTLFDVLAKHKNPTYTKNMFIMETLKSFDFAVFPIYRVLIKNSLKKSERRVKLIEEGEDALITLTRKSSTFCCTRFGMECKLCSKNVLKCTLPNLVSRKTVIYLSDGDLKSLIASSKALEPQLCCNLEDDTSLLDWHTE